MRIGIDIDDTITNTQAMIDEIAQSRKNMKIYDRTKHWFYDRFNCSKDEDEVFFSTYAEEVMGFASIKDGASFYINKLRDEGNEIYIITARSDRYSANIPDITLKYLKDNNINYDHIIFKSKDKAKVCMDNKIDIMVDDAVEHINEITTSGIKVIIMDNEYNRKTDGLRAYNWEDVYKIINGR